MDLETKSTGTMKSNGFDELEKKASTTENSTKRRSRPKLPDAQLYVPRGRQQDSKANTLTSQERCRVIQDASSFCSLTELSKDTRYHQSPTNENRTTSNGYYEHKVALNESENYIKTSVNKTMTNDLKISETRRHEFPMYEYVNTTNAYFMHKLNLNGTENPNKSTQSVPNVCSISTLTEYESHNKTTEDGDCRLNETKTYQFPICDYMITPNGYFTQKYNLNETQKHNTNKTTHLSIPQVESSANFHEVEKKQSLMDLHVNKYSMHRYNLNQVQPHEKTTHMSFKTNPQIDSKETLNKEDERLGLDGIPNKSQSFTFTGNTQTTYKNNTTNCDLDEKEKNAKEEQQKMFSEAFSDSISELFYPKSRNTRSTKARNTKTGDLLTYFLDDVSKYGNQAYKEETYNSDKQSTTCVSNSSQSSQAERFSKALQQSITDFMTPEMYSPSEDTDHKSTLAGQNDWEDTRYAHSFLPEFEACESYLDSMYLTEDYEETESCAGTTQTPDSDFGHVVEMYDFPEDFKTRDLLNGLSDFREHWIDIKWVDDKHALAVFSSPMTARDALSISHPLIKLRPFSEATPLSKATARGSRDVVTACKKRPVTNARVARRLVTGALGLNPLETKEERQMERQQLREARERRRQHRKDRDDAQKSS